MISDVILHKGRTLFILGHLLKTRWPPSNFLSICYRYPLWTHIEWLVFCLFREEIFKNWQINAELSKIPWKIRVAIALCLFTNLVGIHPHIISTYSFKNIYTFKNIWPFWNILVVSMSASYGRLRVRARLCHTKDHYKKIPYCFSAWHTCIRVPVLQCRPKIWKAGFLIRPCTMNGAHSSLSHNAFSE